MHDTRPQPSLSIQSLFIWGAFIASQGMIVLVSQTAMARMPSAPDGIAQIPVSMPPAASAIGHVPEWIFYVAAGACALMALVIPRLLSKGTGETPQMTSQKTSQKILSAWLVRWVLLEAITLIGFLDAMLSAEPSAIYPFAGVALIGFLFSYPSERKIAARAQIQTQ
jgi:hypothetical protein